MTKRNDELRAEIEIAIEALEIQREGDYWQFNRAEIDRQIHELQAKLRKLS